MHHMNIAHHSKLFGRFLFSVEKVIVLLTDHFIEKNICMLCMHCFYVHCFSLCPMGSDMCFFLHIVICGKLRYFCLCMCDLLILNFALSF